MHMRRDAIIALICALALACAPALALADPGVCEGEVIAGDSAAVYATSNASVVSVDALPGQLVEAGDALVTLEPARVYAHSDGVVASVDFAQGDNVDGTVLSVEPTSRYQIVCTVEDAYELPENMLLHVGQTLYAKCTRDGSHRAVARVISIDGEYFTLETLGGELYIGETVYLYSSDEFESKQRVGIGTVIGSSLSEYTASGTLTRICVEPGDIVERGQLLYEYMPGGQSGQDAGEVLLSDTSGIVLSISAQAGQALTAGAVAAEIAPLDALRISVYVSEEDAHDVAAGDAVTLTLPWYEDEQAFAGTVESVSLVSAGMAEQAASTQLAAGTAAANGTSDAAQAGMESTGSAAGIASTGVASSAASDQLAISADYALSGMNSSSAQIAMASTGMAATNMTSTDMAATDMTSTGAQSDGAQTTTTQASAEADEVLYEVRILPAQFDELRIGMSVTVDFNAD